MQIESIESRQNQKIKNLIKLQKRQERLEQGLFIIEGIKELEKAIAGGYQIDSIFFCSAIISKNNFEEIKSKISSSKFYEVNKDIFSKIAYRESTGGIIATAKPKNHELNKFSLAKNPLLLVLEGIEKPGNIGAIYRTADAAGIDAIILCDAKADIYNPNAIRASIGTVFNVPTIISSSVEAISWLNANEISIFSTYLQAALPYQNANFKGPMAIVMGTEATGISQQWIDSATSKIIIPMAGKADSLNVSTATAIVLFEARRQRDFIKSIGN
ncbi:MAG: rRNA methyltransferase [Bacteroidetes bacterium CG2_30_33_31]|nr:MAG: rRNA methyltransferase [Bacteroidetes bacterium CG2_30_33_31]